uniref:Uncharacterized protein n=1 Tax=Romanomermis culicivorax TaxID=13658 RepID=A0A915HSB6_ROMCU
FATCFDILQNTSVRSQFLSDSTKCDFEALAKGTVPTLQALVALIINSSKGELQQSRPVTEEIPMSMANQIQSASSAMSSSTSGKMGCWDTALRTNGFLMQRELMSTVPEPSVSISAIISSNSSSVILSSKALKMPRKSETFM